MSSPPQPVSSMPRIINVIDIGEQGTLQRYITRLLRRRCDGELRGQEWQVPLNLELGTRLHIYIRFM
jgi:hypothetical protein